MAYLTELKSMTISRQTVSRWTCAAALGMFCSAGFAALGAGEPSVHSDESALGATFTKTSGGSFSVYALTTADGVRVREYVSSQGQVFAIAWDGPVLPDLQLLLGTSFAAYRDAIRPRSRSIQLRDGTLFIESGGVMRAFKGRAILIAQLPAGVAEGDIQ